MKVLPLTNYGLVLGMDWLENHSPMKVDWKNKWLATPYEGGSALLQGILPGFPEIIVVQVMMIEEDGSHSIQQVEPPEHIKKFLVEFQEVFQEPTGLPPPRNCDHSIPLLPGAKQVNVRPYRYPPNLKDEIEKQVEEMLSQGVIQQSSSAFSSPMLLVRKKDMSWRFCVDYRFLNALTIKTQYSVPVFDELMDELAGAKWF